MKQVLLLALLLGFAVPSYATTYYVSKSGSDANSCMSAQSLGTAKLTVAAGLACTSGGDTLLINDGTYTERVLGSQIPSGSMGSPTIIKAISRNQVILRPSGSFYVVAITAPDSYITIDGIVADGVNTTSYAYYIGTDAGAIHDIILQNGSAINAQNEPVSGVTNGAFGGCILIGHHSNVAGHYDIQVLNMDISGCEEHGIYLSGAGGIIDGNRVINTGLAGNHSDYQLHSYTSNGGANDWIIRNNRFENGADYGVLIGGGSGIEFYNNIIAGARLQGILLNYWCSGPDINQNTIYGNGSNAILNVSCAGAEARNNIILGNGVNTIDESGGSITDTNNLFTDPGFVNAAIGDFHLQPGSSAIGSVPRLATVLLDFDGVTRASPTAPGAYDAPSGVDPLDPLDEDFDAYTATASIHGLNSGSGWTQSWDLLTGTATVETAPAGMTGKALSLTSTSEVDIKRLFSAHSGIFTISATIRSSITNPNSFGVGFSLLDATGAYQTATYFLSTGDLISDAQTLVAGFAANTNYAIDLNFDTEDHPGQYRARVNAGAYGAWQDCNTTCTSIGGIEINSYSTNAHTFWMDDISDDVGGGAGTITVETPAASQKCRYGQTCLISWASNGITSNVDLYYLIGTIAYPIASPDVAATPYSWTVNAPAATDVKIRVSQGAVTDDSDAFTVLGNYLK
jgi:hypothetical protein